MADIPFDHIASIKTPYKTFYGSNQSIEIYSVNNLVTLKANSNNTQYEFVEGSISIDTPAGTVNLTDNVSSSSNYTFSSNGSFVIRYKGRTKRTTIIGTGGALPQIEYKNFSFYFAVSVIENHLPLKRKTVTDVINRLFDVAEPIRKGEKPRFRLKGVGADGSILPGSQADLLDKIFSPEFSFTKQTLRECLQEIGRFIHGEPRVDAVKDSIIGEYYYEVSYDMYAGQEVSGASNLPYITKNVSYNIENCTASIDSSAENLVNQLDKYAGVIIEPYANGAKTVRTDLAYARIEDGNMIIATQYPIYSVEALEYVYNDGGTVKSVNIRDYLFEASLYNSQLSSYDGTYPYSKAYGIYYTQGQKNIQGLYFNQPAAAFAAFKEYAILNILRRATGNGNLNIDDYPAMAFRVTYTPFYSVRVAQSKAYIRKGTKPTSLIYNQQANVIESRAYGENMKGAVARLGNVDISITVPIKWLSDVPKAGMVYKKDYYVSAVATEILPTYTRCTMGLSKDFNRLSAYIGISSVKRYYEVAQKQALERNLLYREYILISHTINADKDSMIGPYFMETVRGTFVESFTWEWKQPVTGVTAWGTSYKGNDTGSTVTLPVISSAFGNSVSFSWTYEDNYSAGAKSVKQRNSNVTGYFQQDVPYSDYYGAMYYYNFDLQGGGVKTVTAGNIDSLPFELPQSGKGNATGIFGTINSDYLNMKNLNPFVIRKDNREILQVNVQIDFVTDIEDFIIGSALASYSPAVRPVEDGAKPARLYVFPTTLNKFTNHVEAYERDITLNGLPSVPITVTNMNDDKGRYLILSAEAFPASGKAWAIVTAQTTYSEQVEDEYGNITTQEYVKGGDLLIGQNIDVEKEQAFTPVYFNAKREVFDKTVWKDKR